MSTITQDYANDVTAPRLRWWLLAVGVAPFIGTALLVGRLIWEQTVWTWERGPQMVGFSLAHGSYAVLLLAPFLLALWGAVVLVLIVVNLFKKRRTDKPTLIAFGLAGLLFSFDFLPSGFWQRLFIREMAFSPRAADLLFMLRTIRTFARLRQCWRTEYRLPQPTTMNGEPYFTLPRLRGTYARFGFLWPMERT